MSNTNKRLKMEIRGAVQGVGFRPFVYRLASELGLPGWVINDVQGVFIEVEGSLPVLEEFRRRVESECPPRAVLHSVAADMVDAVGFREFEIRASSNQGSKSVAILPDIATCPECLQEVLDTENRRSGYSFTNCTLCGPRFTIVQSLPYDRPNTTMRHFLMCPDCQAEYENPMDRRFHAQPNACPCCGPRESLVDQGGVVLAQGPDAVQLAATALTEGKILALKALGGFQLLADASSEEAVGLLRKRKARGDKPFALMARDLEQAQRLCHVPEKARELLESPESPIVLLEQLRDNGIAAAVAPGNPYLGIMLPCTPLHHLLLRKVDFPVVATSGNLSDEPICIENDEARKRLADIADLYLLHDRPVARHADDSVAWVLADEPRILRRARGYAPLPVLLPRKLPTVLAVGAHLKNTVALAVDEKAVVSQHLGDMETVETLRAFEKAAEDLLGLYEAHPVALAHDLHPDYASTLWARRQAESQGPLSGLPLIPVQHHHAHLAACLAENGVDGPVLGVVWDGTGYGPDGTVWGGEFLAGDATGYDRVARLRPFQLPGGDAAVREPRRSALSLLWELYGSEVAEREDLAPVASFTATERRVLLRMLETGAGSPATSSVGRLFDAVASLLDLRHRVRYEGDAAMTLEFSATCKSQDQAYVMPLATRPGEELPELDWSPLVEAILRDSRQGVDRGIIAARFHRALVESVVEVARHAGLQRIALSGGCFQNRLLTEHAARELETAGFQVLLHRHVPPNDGGISLGQIAVAAARLGQTD